MKKISAALLSSLFVLAIDAAPVKGTGPIDYSYCGYRMSSELIPMVPVKVVVSHEDGDQSERIQRAIDYVSSLKPDKKTGFRGAVLLEDGTYTISKALRISTSGVVLRGASKNGTILCKTGVDRGAAIYIEGVNDKKITDTLYVADDYVPVGSKTLTLSGTVADGQQLEIVRPSTKEWIASIGCDVFGGDLGYWGWKPGEMDVRWCRTTVPQASSQTADNLKTSKPQNLKTSITLDAPLTVALDKKWGSAYALVYTWQGRIHDCAVENITVISDAALSGNNAPAAPSLRERDGERLGESSESHCWDGIYIENAMDCWVRQVNFRGLAGSAVIVHRGAQQVTVEDCMSLQPASEIGGLRRRTFLTMGGKCLFQRLHSEEGINDFSAGYCAPGPNAFVQCDAVGSHGFSGSSSSWATGLLFDNVNIEGGGISFKNLGLDKWGAGWNTANSTVYQCSASYIDCFSPSDDAKCYAIGCWAYCNGNGEWTSTNDHVNPYSLFHEQLDERAKASNLPVAANDGVSTLTRLLVRDHDGSSSPTVEKAAKMAEIALQPRTTMQQWIESAPQLLPVVGKEAKRIQNTKLSLTDNAQNNPVLDIVNARLVQSAASSPRERVGEKTLLTGTLHRTPWWNGRTRYPYMDKADYAVTRFVPGMEQRGGTDRMDSVLVNLERQNVAVWNQNYGLWYDRRRDDHERIKRPDGDVWAPFFEQTIARSGKGQAWDGLSLYDLSKLNLWYFARVNELASRRPDMLVINQSFFQHNILEAGAHWVDCPWRNANNIQSAQGQGGIHTLEPVPFTGDKRIFTADIFYDVNESTPEGRDRAAAYKQYIWNVLDATADNPNIYQSVSEEYTGPQHFVEFWLRCIAEWEKARGRDAHVILNATRDVQQAVMAQPELAQIVDVIEIEQWFYDNGKLFSPEGGKNLAPRQHMRLTKLGHPVFHDVYRAVCDMRQAYPTKPVLYYAKEYDRNPWAVVFAGGSCPTLNITNPALLKALTTLSPVPAGDAPTDCYTLQSADGKERIIYNTSDKPATIALTAKPSKVLQVNRTNGTTTPLSTPKTNEVTVEANSIVWVISQK